MKKIIRSSSPKTEKYKFDAIKSIHSRLPKEGFTVSPSPHALLVPPRPGDKRMLAHTLLGVTEGSEPEVIYNVSDYLRLRMLPPDVTARLSINVLVYPPKDAKHIIFEWLHYEPLFRFGTKSTKRELLAAYIRIQPSILKRMTQRKIAQIIGISVRSVQSAVYDAQQSS